MRQYIINQMHKQIMNEDGTANLECPQWKRRCWAVGGFTALRLWSIVTFAMIPFVILIAIGLYTTEAIKKILVESFIYVGRDTFRASWNSIRSDIRSCTDIWKGE